MNCKSCNGYIAEWDEIGQRTGYCRFHLYKTGKTYQEWKKEIKKKPYSLNEQRQEKIPTKEKDSFETITRKIKEKIKQELETGGIKTT